MNNHLPKLLILKLLFLFFNTTNASACDTSPVLTASNVVDIGGGFFTVDYSICIGADGSEDGFDVTMGCGLNITATSAASFNNGGNIATGSITGGVLTYFFPGFPPTWWEADDFIPGPCFVMTLTVDGDPTGCTITSTGINDGCGIFTTTWSTTVPGPPPPCFVDYVINATGSQAGTTVGGGNNCTVRGSEDQIIQINLACADTYTFDVCGSTWDTYLYLSTTCCGGTIASNDDGCGLQSTITQVLAAGTYYIIVEAFSTLTTGTFNLNVTSGSPCALPVELSYFFGDYDAGMKANVLRWTTSSELYNDYFTIEKMDAFQHFQPMGNVLGSGTTEESSSYRFEDFDYGTGVNYYRLKQVDYSGDFEYSNVIAINQEASESLLATDISPNPANTNFLFKIENIDQEEEVQIRILDNAGRVVMNMMLEEKLNGSYSVDVSDIPMGVYSVVFTSAGKTSTQKLSVVR